MKDDTYPNQGHQDDQEHVDKSPWLARREEEKSQQESNDERRHPVIQCH
jgi:hypothetical protein